MEQQRSHKRSRSRVMTGVSDLLKLYGAAQGNYEDEFKELFKQYKQETDPQKKQELHEQMTKKRDSMSKLLLDASDACKLSAENMYKDKSKLPKVKIPETIEESSEESQ